MQLRTTTPGHPWTRPVTGLCLALCLLLAVLMLYMPFQFQSATLRFIYPYLRWFGSAYGIAAILMGLAGVEAGLPAWAGKAGKGLFLVTLIVQAYLTAFLPGVISGQWFYTLTALSVTASLLRPDREWANLGALYGALSLMVGALVILRPDLFPATVFGALPPGLGHFMLAAGLLLAAAIWMPGRYRPPLWLALLVVSLPFLWFAWQWLQVNNWVGISIYGSMGGWALFCAGYLRFPWRTSLRGFRLRILMLGLFMTALPLVTMGTYSVYVAQALDAREANNALRTAVSHAELAAVRVAAGRALSPAEMAEVAAETRKIIAPTPLIVEVRPLAAPPGSLEAGQGVIYREEFLSTGQRSLSATLHRSDLGVTIVAAYSAGQAFGEAARLAVVAILITALVALAAVFINRFLAYRLTVHLSDVRDVAAAIGAHRYDARVTVPAGPDDEITDLARTVNSVAQTLGDYSQKLHRLLSITDTALAHMALPNLIQELLGRIREALNADSAVILLLTQDRSELVVAGALGLEAEQMQRVHIPIGKGLAGRIAAECQPLVVEDIHEFPVASPFLREGVRSVAGVPLLVEDRVIGVVHVGTRVQHRFSAEEVSLLQMVGDRIALAIDHARAYTAEVQARQEVEAKTQEIRLLNADLERRVTERTAELVKANKELEAFSYSVSHDLRSPLRSINGFSQILLEDYAERLDDVGRDYLQRIGAGSQRMDQLIDAFLRLSRVIRADLLRQTVDLSAMAGMVAAELRTAEARADGFSIQPGMHVSADAGLLRVALENLLSNACKFSSPRPQPLIEVGKLDQEGETVYFVRDNGVGFDMSYSNKLFQPFQRLHPHGEFKGAGVGLATVERIVQRHGGRIWAESRVGEGATFYFTLPSM